MWTCLPVRLLTPSVHPACHSDGAPAGCILLLRVLITHGLLLGFIRAGGVWLLADRAAMNILGQGPGALEWNLRLGMATEFAGSDTEQNMGPWDKSLGV